MSQQREWGWQLQPAWLAFASHHDNAALTKMRAATVRENATEKSAVARGPLAPARELLGELYIAWNRPSEALVEYRATLFKEPNRYQAVEGMRRAAAASGNRIDAAKYAEQRKKITGN